MQGLDLAFKLFVDPGDLVVVEPDLHQRQRHRAVLPGRPARGAGRRRRHDVERCWSLVGAAGRTPQVIYTIPTFQNPSGTTLSLQRRQRLLELAQSWDIVLHRR